LDVRFGAAFTSLNGQSQTYAQGQSADDLFPGFWVVGISPAFGAIYGPGAAFSMLIKTTRGPAPQVTSFDAASAEASATYSSVRGGFWHSNHRISLGASYHHSSLTERTSSTDGFTTLFFQLAPSEVKFLNTPARTRDRIGQFELYASDTLSFSRLSFTVQASVDASQGSSLLKSGQTVNNVHWFNSGGKVGAAYRVLTRRPLVIRAGLARIFDQPTVNVWTTANPEGVGARIYAWNDANGDRLFQPGENTQVLKVYGGPYTRMDPNLQNPRTSEFTLGITQGGMGPLTFEGFGFHRSVQRLMTLVDEGVPFSSYTSVLEIDPGPDATLGTADDQLITVFNQKPETLGQDRYVLTNPQGFSSHSEGVQLRLHLAAKRLQGEAAVTFYRSVAATGPGIDARQNDTSNFLGVYADPNNGIFARGSTFFDRAALGRLSVAMELGWQLRAALIGNYQDGFPYSRVLAVQGLNQGVIGVLTKQRGPGEAGSLAGSMTASYQTIAARLSKSFALRKMNLIGTLDVFNLLNRSGSLIEADATSVDEHWRVPLRVQTPRSVQLGMRLTW
jgi:hypothetical protein